MTLANAKVLHAHFLKIGRRVEAEQLERRYPELKVKEELPTTEEKTEVEGKDKEKSKVVPLKRKNEIRKR